MDVEPKQKKESNMTTENTATNHTHKFNECWRIICAVSYFGGGAHTHCVGCDLTIFKPPILPKI